MVHVGPSTDAVSAVCHMLDLLEEVRRPQDADTARSVGCVALFCFTALFRSVAFSSSVFFADLATAGTREF